MVSDSGQHLTDVSTGLTEERSLALVRAALGTNDIPVTIETVMHWDSIADVAERFRSGRIFLAGDAAHVMPPSGGFGGNTGVQDAHNLAWKLSLVLKGHAGPELLFTYEPERRSTAVFTVEQAYSRYVARVTPDLPADERQQIESDLNVELGYIYHSAAVIPEDLAANRVHENPRESKGRPGTRAPHISLNRGSEQISTLDLFGSNFVLLTGPDGNAWRESARTAARQAGLALDIHQLGGAEGLSDSRDVFTELYGISRTGAVLVRPDGFVAWRVKTADGASAQQVAGVLTSLLCLGTGDQSSG